MVALNTESNDSPFEKKKTLIRGNVDPPHLAEGLARLRAGRQRPDKSVSGVPVSVKPPPAAATASAKVIREVPSIANIGSDVATRLNSSKPKVELPGNGRLLSQFAAEIAHHLKTCGLYERGGIAFIPNQQQNGLEVITPQMLRTLVENHLVCYRVLRARESKIRLDRTMSEGDAKGVLCAQQFLSKLPKLEKYQRFVNR